MDAYRIAARTYPWIGWLMIGVTVVATALGVLAAALIHGSWFSLILLGLLIGVLSLDHHLVDAYRTRNICPGRGDCWPGIHGD